MAIKTMSHNTGTGAWAEGWHKLTIEKAEYGDWNDKRFLDVWFVGYPENFNLRIYEAINKGSLFELKLDIWVLVFLVSEKSCLVHILKGEWETVTDLFSAL